MLYYIKFIHILTLYNFIAWNLLKNNWFKQPLLLLSQIFLWNILLFYQIFLLDLIFFDHTFFHSIQLNYTYHSYAKLTLCLLFFIFSPIDSPLKTMKMLSFFFFWSEKLRLFSILCNFFTSFPHFPDLKEQMTVQQFIMLWIGFHKLPDALFWGDPLSKYLILRI